MATGHLSRFNTFMWRFSTVTKLRHTTTCAGASRCKSSAPPPSGPMSKVEIGVTSDGKTIVCYHPTVDFPYEFSQPIQPADPLRPPADTVDGALQERLSRLALQEKPGPTIEELSKMFYTTKHRWFPIGTYRMRRFKKNPPKDR